MAHLPNVAWHNAMALYLMHAARGDLILDRDGDLCQRNTNNDATMRELPFMQHGIGTRLIKLQNMGMVLTPYGAQFILENCPPEGAKAQRDTRYLRIVAEG